MHTDAQPCTGFKQPQSFPQSSVAFHSFTPPTILYRKEPRGGCWLLTSGRRAVRSSCSGAAARWARSARCSLSSCHRPRPSPSGRLRSGPADRSRTSWTPCPGCPRSGSCCDPCKEKQKHSCNSSGMVTHRHRCLILHSRECKMVKYQRGNQHPITLLQLRNAAATLHLQKAAEQVSLSSVILSQSLKRAAPNSSTTEQLWTVVPPLVDNIQERLKAPGVSYSLGDAERGDFCWVCVVFAIKCRVHS